MTMDDISFPTIMYSREYNRIQIWNFDIEYVILHRDNSDDESDYYDDGDDKDSGIAINSAGGGGAFASAGR